MEPTGPGAIGVTMKGRTVTDEVCQCGCSIRDHKPLPGLPEHLGSWIGTGFLMQQVRGKGPCSKCDCARFRWEKFLFED